MTTVGVKGLTSTLDRTTNKRVVKKTSWAGRRVTDETAGGVD